MKTFAELLAEGPQIGLSHMYPAPGIIERIGPDWDWIWIDAQHGELDYSDVLGSVRACNLIGKPAVVRVPGHEAVKLAGERSERPPNFVRAASMFCMVVSGQGCIKILQRIRNPARMAQQVSPFRVSLAKTLDRFC